MVKCLWMEIRYMGHCVKVIHASLGSSVSSILTNSNPLKSYWRIYRFESP